MDERDRKDGPPPVRREDVGSRQGPVRPVPPQSRAAAAVGAVVPVVRRVSRALRRLALAAAAGGAVLWWLLADRVVSGDGRAAGLLIWALVLLVAPAILLAVSLALHALVGIPERVATLPARAQERAAELGRLAEEVRRKRRRGWARSGMATLRLWRTTAGSRELLELAGPAAFLFSPGTWLAAALATVVAVAEVVAGVIAALILVAS